MPPKTKPVKSAKRNSAVLTPVNSPRKKARCGIPRKSVRAPIRNRGETVLTPPLFPPSLLNRSSPDATPNTTLNESLILEDELAAEQAAEGKQN